jgi:hypothetical protein
LFAALLPRRAVCNLFELGGSSISWRHSVPLIQDGKLWLGLCSATTIDFTRDTMFGFKKKHRVLIH